MKITNNPYSNTGNNVRTVRKELNKRQFEFAEELGVEPNYISMIERGVRPVSYELAKKISKIAASPASVEWLMGESDFRTREEELHYEMPLLREEARISAWDCLISEIAEYGGFDLSPVRDSEMKFNFSGAVIPFDELRSDMLDYAKFYINQRIAKSKKEDK